MKVLKINKDEVTILCENRALFSFHTSIYMSLFEDFSHIGWTERERERFESQISDLYDQNPHYSVYIKYTLSRRELSLILETLVTIINKFDDEMQYYDNCGEDLLYAKELLEDLCKIQLLFLEEDKKK